MKQQTPVSDGNRGQLLIQQLAENEQKLASLNHEQALKLAELNRVQQQLEELNKLYPYHKRK